MRILYTNFHQADGGGHTTYVLSLVRALRAAHDIVVAAPAGSRLFLEASGMPGVRVVPMEFKGGLLSAWPRIRRMRALLKIERFDLVHVNGAADHRLCMLASMGLRGGRPAIVYTQHTSRSGRSLGAALRARLATDRVICVSEHTRRGLMRSHYAGCGLRTVKNGVDVDYFTPATPEEKALARERWLRPSQAGCLVVGSNAGTAVYKNWPDMLEAVAMLPGALRRRIVVLIAGEPPNEDRLRYVESLGMQDRAIFVGLLDDVRPFLAALDLGFVLSSRLETISFACREMMAMGLPVVVSDVGGLPENVEDGVDGWVVPACAPTAVSEVLREALREPEALEVMGEAARARALAEFGLSRFVAQTQAVYLEALDLPRPSRLWPIGWFALGAATFWIQDLFI